MAITSSTWAPISEAGLNQAINANSTTKNYEIGHRVRCRDTSTQARGEAEFEYRGGVASCVEGSLCCFDGDIVLLATTRSVGPVGVAMAATVASEYGWFQVTGNAKVKAVASIADNAQVYTCATAGSADDAVVTGDMVHGMRSTSATDTGFITAVLDHPACADTNNA